MTSTDLKRHFFDGMWPGGGEETVSGSGSTVRYTEMLRPVLGNMLRSLNVKTFLDAPCGDFNWMKHVDLTGVEYVGIDIVEGIISRNKELYSTHNVSFHCRDITLEPLPSADLLLCRDVLLHLPFWAIADLFENIVRTPLSWVLVSSHVVDVNKDLDVPGRARFVNIATAPFHFPIPPDEHRIPDWVSGFPERYLYLYSKEEFDAAAHNAIATIRSGPVGPFVAGELREERRRPKTVDEFRAGAPARVMEYASMSSNPDILYELLFRSLRHFGFFTKQASRYLEYPWIATTIRQLHGRGPVVDLGAGVSPIPLFLAGQELQVVTVDYSPIKRSLDNLLHEWGFLDYSALSASLSSHNCDFSQIELDDGSIGTIYSISVIEHMPAVVRRKVVAMAARLLHAGGNLILTLDLKAGSLDLWNLDRGKIVDAKDHGALDDFIDELRTAGLTVRSLDIRRGLPGSSTDVAFMVAVK